VAYAWGQFLTGTKSEGSEALTIYGQTTVDGQLMARSYRATGKSAIVAQLVAAVEMNWSCPYGKPLSKYG
jgi:hypothetical protein